MFSRKKKPVKQDEQARGERLRAEGLGEVWGALTGQNPAAIMPQIVATVLKAGGTRPAWQWQRQGREFVMMAWPEDQPIRASVLMCGNPQDKLKPVSAVPLLEGLPNDLIVEAVQPRKEGMGADIGVSMIDDKSPMWFYDPFYSRDEDDLTPGVMHTFLLSGAILACRRALLDCITITQGPKFEAHAQAWLQSNPDKSRLDVPPLKIEIKNRHIIMPGRHFCEYEIRGVIEKVEEWQFEKMPIKTLYFSFPFDNRPSMLLPLYVSDRVLGDYIPEKGQEIEAYIWLEGRVIDMDQSNPADA